ncbi:MAG TPA: UvrD-helicase domain-containing protein, partial [Ktedonobacteraceae bacterium]|nr:UvrD-helicase domain-containing protein [Ktedonobacteraceae bacterium]
MDDRARTTATAGVEAARHLLHWYQTEHPGWKDKRTPLDDLVSWLGLRVETFHPEDYPAGTYGFLEPGEDLIWLSRTLSASLRRFTLAHEVGHVLLHSENKHAQRLSRGRSIETSQHIAELSREDPCQRPDVQEEVTEQTEQELIQEVLGIGQSYDPRSGRELAANIFAAELLMPLEQVRTLYLNEHVSPGELSSIFDVSNAAMLNRLVSLVMEPAAPTPGRSHEGGRPPGSPLPWTETPIPDRVDDGSQPGQSSRATTTGRATTRVAPTMDGNATKAPAKKQYDEFQRAAIEAPAPALIVAGPGSGKTSTLIGRTEYLINTLDVQPEHILALTFSRKAAQEMQERLEQALRKDEQQESVPVTATRHIPMVSTFHAFCAEMLRTYGGLVGLRPDFALIDDTEGYFLLRQLAREMQLYHYRNLQSPAYYFPDILKAISRAKDELVPPEQYQQLALDMLKTASDEEAVLSAKKTLEVAAIYALYEEALRARGDTDFGGLIMLAAQALRAFPEVLYEQQQRFQHILVDEFQDINRA